VKVTQDQQNGTVCPWERPNMQYAFCDIQSGILDFGKVCVGLLAQSQPGS